MRNVFEWLLAFIIGLGAAAVYKSFFGRDKISKQKINKEDEV